MSIVIRRIVDHLQLLKQSVWTRYLNAVLITILCVLIRIALRRWLGNEVPLLLPFFAVILSSLLGGFGPGMLSTALGAILGRYFFFEPLGRFSLLRVDQQINFGIYTALGILVSALNEALREAERRARRNQDEARQSEARVNNILSSITDCFFELDREYRMVEMNERASEFLGKPREFFIGKVIWDLSPALAHSEFDSQYRRAFATMQPVHFEARSIIAPDRFGEYHAYPSAGGLAIYFRDITEQRKVANELAQAAQEKACLLRAEQQARAEAQAANRSKDDFLATLSHDLRAPLNAILGWSNLLRASNPSAEELSKGLDVIERNICAQTRLIDDLLDISRIGSGKLHLEMQILDLGAVVHLALETVQPEAKRRGVELQDLTIDSAAHLPVLGDPVRLQQVAWNLLGNAVKFTPADGKVDAELRRAGRNVEFLVRDTGCGIPSEFLPRIFDRFSQAAPSSAQTFQGLGLGLAICRHLVELHGGTIRAESCGMGLGATFIVQLPLASAADAGLIAQKNIQREKTIRSRCRL
jgi:PAS domain S-box-containing protein